MEPIGSNDTNLDNLKSNSGQTSTDAKTHRVGLARISALGNLIGSLLRGISSAVSHVLNSLIMHCVSTAKRGPPTKTYSPKNTSPEKPPTLETTSDEAPNATTTQMIEETETQETTTTEETEIQEINEPDTKEPQSTENQNIQKQPTVHTPLSQEKLNKIFAQSLTTTATAHGRALVQLRQAAVASDRLKKADPKYLEGGKEYDPKRDLDTVKYKITDIDSLLTGKEPFDNIDFNKSEAAYIQELGLNVKGEFEELATREAMAEGLHQAWKELKGILDTKIKQDKSIKAQSLEAMITKTQPSYFQLANLINMKFYSLESISERSDDRYIQTRYGYPDRIRLKMAQPELYAQFSTDPPPFSASMLLLIDEIFPVGNSDSFETAESLDAVDRFVQQKIEALSQSNTAFEDYSKYLQADAARALQFPMNLFRQCANLVNLTRRDIKNIKRGAPKNSKYINIKYFIKLLQPKNKTRKSAIRYAIKTSINIAATLGGVPKLPLDSSTSPKMLHSLLKILAEQGGLDDASPSMSKEIHEAMFNVVKRLNSTLMMLYDIQELEEGREAPAGGWFGEQFSKKWAQQQFTAGNSINDMVDCMEAFSQDMLRDG